MAARALSLQPAKEVWRDVEIEDQTAGQDWRGERCRAWDKVGRAKRKAVNGCMVGFGSRLLYQFWHPSLTISHVFIYAF